MRGEFRHWLARKLKPLERYKTPYEVVIVVLALVSIVIALADLLDADVVVHPRFSLIESFVLFVFTVDYVVRLLLAENKLTYVRRNVFELIAIIPFDTIFYLMRTMKIIRLAYLARLARFSRVTRITKIARLIGVGGRLRTRVDDFLRMNGLIYIIYLNFASILGGAIAIFLLEKGTTVNTFGDALWWSIVTATTVGYGDVAPATGGGRIVAVIVMLLGIGLVAVLTGTIATYFTVNANKTERDLKLDRLRELTSTMSEAQLEHMIWRAQTVILSERGVDVDGLSDALDEALDKIKKQDDAQA